MICYEMEKRHFLRQLGDVKFYYSKIKAINLELEEVAHKLYGIGGVKYDVIRGSNPSGYPYTLLMAEEKLIKERQKYIDRLEEIGFYYKQFSREAQSHLLHMFILEENHENYAMSIYTSRGSIHWKIDQEFKQILNSKHRLEKNEL